MAEQRIQPPLSLYIHIPWCLRKCPYCDFNSHEIPDGGSPHGDYLDALLTDLESQLPRIWGRKVVSVFFGGGTPSLLTAPALDGFLSALRARINLDPGAEITLEANPGSFEAARYEGYRAAGVNRLSVGVQSFNDERLRALGRVHDAAQARAALDAARRCFDNLNIDLMIGLPGQDLGGVASDLDAALSFAPDHLSVYQLTLEPNTVFHKYPPGDLPAEDVLDEMQALVDDRLAGAGYVHYEVSAYAKPGRNCVHNTNYWQFGDYLGIGAGAHGKLSLPEGVIRTEQARQPDNYLMRVRQGRSIVQERTLAREDLVFEFLLNALRLTGGFAPALFTAHTGLPVSIMNRRLQEASARGLLSLSDQRIQPTGLGMRFLNDLQALFLPDA